MKKIALLIFLISSPSYATPLYFDMSQASGTEMMKNIKSAEFLFEQQERNLRHCGFWQMQDGSIKKFELSWELDGSTLKQNGKSIGSYYDGNIMLEELQGLVNPRSIEVSRFNETFFEYHFHQQELGFVDGDGWLRDKPSEKLAKICL